MANLTGMYSADKAKEFEHKSFEPMPVGNYTVMMTEEEVKVTGGGHTMLAITLEVVDGEFKGRKLWDHLMLISTNPDPKKKNGAEARGSRSIYDIAEQLAGVDENNVEDSSLLKMKPFMVHLKQEVKQQNGAPVLDLQGKPEIQNRVEMYKAKGDAPVGVAPVATDPAVVPTATVGTVAPATPPVAGAKPDW